MIRVSILGATGYSGGELLRLLLHHPGVVVTHLTSQSAAGQSVVDTHPSLRGQCSLRFEKFNVRTIARDSDIVFSCFPAGAGLRSTAQLIRAGVKVIDLSADFRLPTSQLYKKWYKGRHTAPHLLRSRVYGLPELFRDRIVKANLVANPGCYATAALLSAAPLIKAKWVDPHSLIVDAKSGVSGAGKKMDTSFLFGEANESVHAYAVTAHRHQPEIETALKEASATSVQLTFTPHLIPMNRGILSVLYATLKRPKTTKEIHSLFSQTYHLDPFVRVLPEGQGPQTKNVNHTNYCDIGIFQDSRTRRVLVIAALDNLGKGAASQAVQNMNLLSDRSETEGLL